MKADFEDNYKALFRRYHANLLFYATRLVGEVEAEDVVQDVFVELWRRRNEVEIGDDIQAFLYKAVYTRSLNVLKHRAVVGNHEELMLAIGQKRAEYYASEESEVVKRIEDRELRSTLSRAIGELPDKCRVVFKLSYLHDMKNKDIAQLLKVSPRTVEAHMYKALRYLRNKLIGVAKK
ncbi:MAG: RNA polymerase sigma-70 factor [Muribaculaceae bacterium]